MVCVKELGSRVVRYGYESMGVSEAGEDPTLSRVESTRVSWGVVDLGTRVK